MDTKLLYQMTRAAALAAERVGQIQTGKVGDYAGYPAYIQEYNRLLPLVITEFGEEAQTLFRPIDIGQAIEPELAYSLNHWRLHLDTAIVALNRMSAYLLEKLGQTDEEIQNIINLINANLRAAMFTDPQREVDVQNQLHVIFKARSLDFRRETVAIEYSSKTFKPDFVFDSLDLALEVKLCNEPNREKTIIDEINADIPAYRTKYGNLLFVVYDMGIIRDIARFKSGIEANPGVRVIIVKK